MSNHQPVKERSETREVCRFRNSTKLQEHHFDRTAIVYVRQSSPHQVLQNTESTARQYALADRAVQLGWSADHVEVIDEDQGRSGTTAEGRLGFQRLLTEVSLNHVGIILGTEMSRIARSNKDWHQLIEMCAIFGTLLADQDGLYDPADYNDRLLLGLRGMMNEAEIHILQGRMHEALLNKARRGELYMLPPVGYIKTQSGKFALDPDEQAQSVIRIIFDELDRRGSIRAVLRYLQANDIKMPIRPHLGPSKGVLEWRRPTRELVRTVLMHPLYAGTYRYGHRQTDQRRKKPGRPQAGRVVVESDEYHALIYDHCPAYITRERYERNQRTIRNNRLSCASKGSPRDGQALLGGIVFCARCNRRMAIHYAGSGNRLRYLCTTGLDDSDIPRCQSLSGNVLDELVTKKIMMALEPAGLELSLLAAGDLEQERQRLDRDWRQRLERSRYEADRARRQYQVVEPENRLVARELERQWEAALGELEALEKDYARFRQTHPTTLSEAERDLIRGLSRNLPDLWHAPTTLPSDRQRIVRLLIERVEINIPANTDHVDVSLVWSGGFNSRHELVRPVLGYDQMADYDRLIQRIKELRHQGSTFSEIAEHLNREGFRPAQRAKRFHKNIVGRLFRKLTKQKPNPRGVARQEQLGDNEWLAITLAEKLQMRKNTLLSWTRRGWIHVVRQLPGYRGQKICWADAAEINRLIRLRDAKRRACDPPHPAELTTPKTPAQNQL